MGGVAICAYRGPQLEPTIRAALAQEHVLSVALLLRGCTEVGREVRATVSDEFLDGRDGGVGPHSPFQLLQKGSQALGAVESKDILVDIESDEDKIVDQGCAVDAGHLPGPGAAAKADVLQEMAETVVSGEHKLPETPLRVLKTDEPPVVSWRGAQRLVEIGIAGKERVTLGVQHEPRRCIRPVF